jgi:hypothetical protein
MKKTLLIFLCFLLSGIGSIAQELNCKVQVMSPKLQSNPANKEIFESLQTVVFEFMNNTKWTNDKFKPEERIDCTILINISDKISSDVFSGSIQIQASRPVFNSSYSSMLLNYNDNDFKINFLRNTRLVFSPDKHQNNLTSILAFYAYMILGYDYDSFSMEGGSQYFNKAQNVVSNATNAPESGWKAFEGNKNRYWLVDNALQNVFKPLRQCFYKYHRLGFDMLYDDVAKGRRAVMQGLELIEKVHKNRPGSFNVQLFFTAKADELVNLFSQAFPDEKNKAVNLLKKLDPTNATKYQKILKGE